MYCIFLPYFRITRVEPQASAVACVSPVVQHLFERIEPGTLGFTRIGKGPTITMLIDRLLTLVVEITKRALPPKFRCFDPCCPAIASVSHLPFLVRPSPQPSFFPSLAKYPIQA